MIPAALENSSLLVNAIGHCAGALAFGLLLYLILISRRRTYRADHLVTAAAALAFLWNAGSLLGLMLTGVRGMGVGLVVAGSFAALSLLPAVLFEIAMPTRGRPLVLVGYALSSAATLLHLLETLSTDPRFHSAALIIITVGFSVLATVAAALDRTWDAGRLVTSMSLFLLAVSFVHFRTGHVFHAWSSEAAFHHACIPLAMIILLRDYRFLLLDAFLRLAVDGALAVGTAWGLFLVADSAYPLSPATHPWVRIGALIGTSLALAGLVWTRGRLQRLLTRFVFSQPDTDLLILRLRTAMRTGTVEDGLAAAGQLVADAFSCTRWAWEENRPSPAPNGAWAEAVVPVRPPALPERYLLLGPRHSRRRYLSEDFETLALLATVLAEEAGRQRAAETERLMTQAELLALQAQINPHFLFNALNTVYGVIDRENSAARRLVLHLSGLLRFFFRPGQMLIPLDEELRIVHSYLEIEKARLGEKLIVELEVAPEAGRFQVPPLCIEPLVENAVKHGAASRAKGGTVALTIRLVGRNLRIEVGNSGPFVEPDSPNSGVGLANVRRRLELWYGTAAEFEVRSTPDWTQVVFSLPENSPAAQVTGLG